MEKDYPTAEVSVPYIAHEKDMARLERTIRNLTVALVVAVVLLFASCVFCIYEWSRFDCSTITVDSDESGNASYLRAGADGVINNVEGDSQNKSEEGQ